MDEEKTRKLAADCWKRGSEAMFKHSWDQAIDLFRQACEHWPDNVMYRQSLEGCKKLRNRNEAADRK